MKIDKSLIASVALHVAVLGWGIVSFSARSMEAPPVESMPVDIISADQLSKMTAGTKTGQKDKPKPLVERVADASNQVDEPLGKITEKKEVATASAPEPPPKPVEKPVEKKPDPPKQAVEQKETPKPVEKKPDPPKVDPIAEALKKDDSKKPPPPKPEAKAAPPQPPKPKQDYKFDQSKIAALIDKREPSHQAVTGATLNSNAALGTARGTSQSLSQSELDAMRAKLASLWNIQAGSEHPEELFVTVRIRLTPDRRLAGPPQVVSSGNSPRYQAAADAAIRAVLQGQPYTMLRDETYDQWKYMDIDFDPKSMFHS